jgi:hypothetical protein
MYHGIAFSSESDPSLYTILLLIDWPVTVPDWRRVPSLLCFMLARRHVLQLLCNFGLLCQHPWIVQCIFVPVDCGEVVLSVVCILERVQPVVIFILIFFMFVTGSVPGFSSLFSVFISVLGHLIKSKISQGYSAFRSSNLLLFTSHNCKLHCVKK